MEKLSLASKQSLLSIVKKEINNTQEYYKVLQQANTDLYMMSDINNEKTLIYFNRLNRVRNMMRLNKKRTKQLARIAKELKLSMK